MSERIHNFTIIGQSAWHDTFLYSVLEENHDKLFLNVIKGKETYVIDISNQNAVIQELETMGIRNLDNHIYDNKWMTDGYRWCLHIEYDDIDIVSGGLCSKPKELLSLFRYLNIPVNKTDKSEWDIKGKEMNDLNRISFICDAKDIARRAEISYSVSDFYYKSHVCKMESPGIYKMGVKG